MVIERLDGTYNATNEVGQYPLYNTVAGVVNLTGATATFSMRQAGGGATTRP